MQNAARICQCPAVFLRRSVTPRTVSARGWPALPLNSASAVAGLTNAGTTGHATWKLCWVRSHNVAPRPGATAAQQSPIYD